MIDFIVNNYLIIMIITAFLVFALIGFAVDTTKNRKNKESDILTTPNEQSADNIAIDDNEIIQESIDKNIQENVNEQLPAMASDDEDFNESSPINNEIPEPEPINTNMNNQ